MWLFLVVHLSTVLLARGPKDEILENKQTGFHGHFCVFLFVLVMNV